MIGFKTNDTWLDLPKELKVSLEINNPLFQTDYIPGTFTMPYQLPADSPVNQKLLGFPGEPSLSRYRRRSLDCQMYLMDQLWRKGKQNILRKTTAYEVNFQTDVGDLEAKIKTDSMQELDLGTDTLVLKPSKVYPLANYALFPVRNDKFYDGKFPDFCKYVNYYNEGFPRNTDKLVYTITPFPYLVYILKQVFRNYGYEMEGTWLEQEEVRRVVIYNTQSLDQPDFTFDTRIQFNRHVPNMPVIEFIRAIRAFFAIGFVFHPARKVVEVVRLKDVVLDNRFLDLTRKAGRKFTWEPNNTDGFTLKMAEDSNDEFYKLKPATWGSYKVGNGKEDIPVGAGTLGMIWELPPLNLNIQWVVPKAQQKGNSVHLEGSTNPFSLRLLSYQGMIPTQSGTQQYPYGTSADLRVEDYSIAKSYLVWEGANGLYEQCHKDWLQFRSQAEVFESYVQLEIADIMALNPQRKFLINYEEGTLKGIWEKIAVTVDKNTGLQQAKVTLHKVPY